MTVFSGIDLRAGNTRKIACLVFFLASRGPGPEKTWTLMTCVLKLQVVEAKPVQVHRKGVVQMICLRSTQSGNFCITFRWWNTFWR